MIGIALLIYAHNHGNPSYREVRSFWVEATILAVSGALYWAAGAFDRILPAPWGP